MARVASKQSKCAAAHLQYLAPEQGEQAQGLINKGFGGTLRESVSA